MHCRTTQLQRARAPGAAAAAHQVGVALHQADALHRDARLCADDHRERRLVALAMRRGAGHHRGTAIGVHRHRAVLAGATTGGDLHVHRHPDAEQHSITTGAARRLLPTKLVVPRQPGHFLERSGVRPAVVRDAGERVEREHVVGQQVAPPDLDGVDAQGERRMVDGALEQSRRLRPTSAAVGPHGSGVGRCHQHIELDARERIRTVRHAAGACRQERAEPRIRASIAHQPHAQPGERAVAAATQLDVLHLAPAVRERHHVLATRRHPRDRTAARRPPRRPARDTALPCRRSPRRRAG